MNLYTMCSIACFLVIGSSEHAIVPNKVWYMEQTVSYNTTSAVGK
jgi:hypothetical protein